jgi:hypothetical protein
MCQSTFSSAVADLALAGSLSVSMASSLACFLALAKARTVVDKTAVATFSTSFVSGGFVSGGYANNEGRALETISNLGILILKMMLGNKLYK